MISSVEHATRARNGLWAAFLLMGIVSMGWVPRIPEIKDAINLSNGEFGVALLGSACGTLLGAQLGGRAIHTFGSRRAITVAIVLMPLGLVGLALAKNGVELFLGLFIMGMGYSLMDLAYNFQAVVVEKILRQRWMVSFHAMWSVGALLTSVLGAVITRTITPQANLMAIAIVAFVFFIFSTRALLNGDLDEHSGEEEHEAKVPLFTRQVIPLWLLGFGIMGSMIAEGAASDWGGILLRDEMGFEKGIYPSAFASYSIAMIISRFLGDKTLEKFGPATTVKLGGYIGGISWALSIWIAIATSSRHPLLALVIINLGFFIAGFGIGPMFPAYMLAASATPGVSPAVAMARVGVIGMAGYFIGPTLIGVIAQNTSLPIGMMLPILFLLYVGYSSHAMRIK